MRDLISAAKHIAFDRKCGRCGGEFLPFDGKCPACGVKTTQNNVPTIKEIVEIAKHNNGLRFPYFLPRTTADAYVKIAMIILRSLMWAGIGPDTKIDVEDLCFEISEDLGLLNDPKVASHCLSFVKGVIKEGFPKTETPLFLK